MSDFELIYENMLQVRGIPQTEILKFSPINDFMDSISSDEEESECSCGMKDEEDEEELSETDEVSIGKDIIQFVNELEEIALDAYEKSYQNKLENVADGIRELANKLIRGHSKNV